MLLNILFTISSIILSSFCYFYLWKQKDPFLKRISKNKQWKKMEYFVSQWYLLQVVVVIAFICANFAIYSYVWSDLYKKVITSIGLAFIVFVVFIVPNKEAAKK